MNKRKNLFARIFYFYYDGFSNMTWGKKLWAIILLKLFIFFFVMKMFFFPNLLKKNFDSKEERGEHVLENLINP